MREPDFDLTPAELREVAAFTLAAADAVLPVFERDRPDDARPRRAVEACRVFVRGAPRSTVQRIAAPAAHRAAREAGTEPAFHAAMAAGDAAASAYLHPLADAAQVGHILRAAAHATRVAELQHPGDPEVTTRSLAAVQRRASPSLVRVLGRYPITPEGGNRITRLVHQLDLALRDPTASET